MQYFIHHNNQQIGPFTEAEVKAKLAAGEVSPQDHVWWEGQQGWTPLGQTALAGTVAPAVPRAPIVPQTTAATASDAPTSKLAVWALVLGCLGFFLSLLASIPAIVLGHMSLNEIKRNPGMQGRGMALAGTILGYVFTLILPILSIIAISVLIALGNQVKGTFNTINAQLQAAQAAQATNSANASPDQSTPASSPDQSTNSAPASTNSPDSSTNSAPSTNAAPATQ
jgi:hypothetical protein